MIDLNDFVPPGSDLQVTDGETINDRGEIAGSGMLPNGDFHAIVLVPCDDNGQDCLSVRENQNAGPRAGPRAVLPVAHGEKLNSREMLAKVHSQMTGRFHVSGAGKSHR